MLEGAGGREVLDGARGDDRLSGGVGNDSLEGAKGKDKLAGGAGNDAVNARDGKRDRVDCGKGRDRARVDRVDNVRQCERVRR